MSKSASTSTSNRSSVVATTDVRKMQQDIQVLQLNMQNLTEHSKHRLTAIKYLDEQSEKLQSTLNAYAKKTTNIALEEENKDKNRECMDDAIYHLGLFAR